MGGFLGTIRVILMLKVDVLLNIESVIRTADNLSWELSADEGADVRLALAAVRRVLSAKMQRPSGPAQPTVFSKPPQKPGGA